MPQGRGRWRRERSLLLGLACALAMGPAGFGAAPSPAPGASPAPSPTPAKKTDAPRLIDLHVGIPGFVYLGQTLAELTARFPAATKTPFAGQKDTLVIGIPEEGVSCYVVGSSPEDLRVASIGFNFDQVYMGAREGNFRTREGIGKGSTINDLLGTYGRPVQVSGERATKPALHGKPQGEDPDAPKKYQYASPDGATKTYFVVQYDRVLRVVINSLAPLGQHLFKRPPEP